VAVLTATTAAVRATMPSPTTSPDPSDERAAPAVAATAMAGSHGRDAISDSIPEMLPRDMSELVRIFGGIGDGEEIAPPPPTDLSVGDQRRFWLTDLDRSEVYAITATLQVLGECAQFWVEDGVELPIVGLSASSDRFCAETYPLSREQFGSEWNPGVDSDPRLVVLNARILGASGYFGSSNEFPTSLNPHSNQAEIVFINVDSLQPGSEAYDAVLAHEFQHMIHWNQDSNEDAWLNEGCSELAEMANGFGYSTGQVQQFARDPDLQVSDWPEAGGRLGAHYGASFLFVRYIANRLGQESIAELVASSKNGMSSVREVLRGSEVPSLEALLGDWWIANWSDSSVAGVGTEYGYPLVDVPLAPQVWVQALPYAIATDVAQYGADYYRIDTELVSERPLALRVRLSAADSVALLPASVGDAGGAWWSNRGDASHSWMACSLDLRSAVAPELHYEAWHQIEIGWDYAYLSGSADGGVSYISLEASGMTTDDPIGGALAVGYTGFSGGETGDVGHWLSESVSLESLAGSEDARLRFDYVTDDAINLPGLCLRNLRVVERGEPLLDLEGEDIWEADGFCRVQNVVPQRFLLQVVSAQGEVLQVERMLVENGCWEGAVQLDDPDEAVVIVSALADHTTERAAYKLELLLGEPHSEH